MLSVSLVSFILELSKQAKEIEKNIAPVDLVIGAEKEALHRLSSVLHIDAPTGKIE